MARLIEDTSGRLELGLFFELEALKMGDWEAYPRAIVNDVLVDSELYEPLRAEEVDYKGERKATGRCPQHPEVKDRFRVSWAEIALHGAHGDGLFIGGQSELLYVSPPVAGAILAGDFRGTRFALAKVVYSNCSLDPKSSDALQIMCFDGASAYRPRIVDPPERNGCLNCGFTPAVCSNCGHEYSFCPSCRSRLVWRPLDDTQQAPPTAIRFVSTPHEGRVISLDRWDGSDFLGGGSMIVTGRVVDVLFSLNPRPLCARALRCYVGDHAPNEYEHLRSRHFK